MLFAVIRHDKPDSVGLRQETRPRHLDYLEGVTKCITYGGALLNTAGQQIGSILIIDVEDQTAAERLAATDPFVQAGLFQSTHVLPFRQVFEDGSRI